MKKTFLVLAVFFAIQIGASAQENMGLLPMTPEQEQALNDIPLLQLTEESQVTSLPYMVDNSMLPYFRKPFVQAEKSCLAAAEIGYVFTYEINRLKGVHFNEFDSTTYYAPGYIWNFNNGGDYKGVLSHLGFGPAKYMGAANVKDFGGMYNNVKKWMTGYDKYLRAATNRVQREFQIKIGTPPEPDKLEILKHYLNDHGVGAETGGIVAFTTLMNNFSEKDSLKYPSYDSGAWVLTDMHYYLDSVGEPDPSGHRMTVVGYDDSVMYDINGDGLFTNDRDNNGDGDTTMRDWEIGALKVANTRGEGWLDNEEGNRGFIYWPYRLLAQNSDGDYCVRFNTFYGIDVISDPQGRVELKTKIDYNHRDKVVWEFGWAKSLDSIVPSTVWEENFGGGDLPMQGINNEPIEMIINFCTRGALIAKWGKRLFLKIYTDGEPGGELLEYSLKDLDGTMYHLGSEVLNRPLVSESNTEYMIFDYDYISSTLPGRTVIDQDFTINKETTVTGDSYCSLTLRNSHFTFLNNGNLDISHGSNLNIDGNVTMSSNSYNNGVFLAGILRIERNAALTMESGLTLRGLETGKVIVGGTLNLSNQQLNNLTVEVQYGGKLIIEDDVTFNANTNLIVQQGGVIESANGPSNLTINGELSLPSGIQITNFTQNNTGGITFTGTGGFDLLQANIQNTRISATFHGYNPQIKNCNFDNSPLYLMGLKSNGCYVANNQFTNATGAAALKIEGFLTYTISGNNFTNNQSHAISLYKAGRKTYRQHLISNNTIYNNSDRSSAKGILLYSSVADIRDNKIHNNDFGIGLYHNSSVKMWGDPEKASQQIYSNEYNQVYALDNSFPWFFKWNVVQDAGSPYAIVYCRDIKNIRYDVRENCWGEKFDPHNDLDPFELFTFFPAWDCGLNLDGSGTTPLPREKYELALTQIENENYTAADAQLKAIVNQWPESEFAATAMKTMPDVAQKRGNVDDLINYYNTEANIQDNLELAKLAGYLKADCEVLKERYQEALDFYAGIIENPPTPEDETYAIIDAGYVQYLMDDNKAQGTFKYAELIPKTRQAYAVKRKQLLDALGGQVLQADQLEETENETIADQGGFAKELRIYPNPTSGKVNIEFITKESGNKVIEIVNTSGQCVYSHAITEQTESKINHSLSTTNMASGIYYVQIRINDKYVTGKKMVVY